MMRRRVVLKRAADLALTVPALALTLPVQVGVAVLQFRGNAGQGGVSLAVGGGVASHAAYARACPRPKRLPTLILI